MRRGRGFTLIELLVVIAIIAILAAILFPVFMKVRQNAFATKCLVHGKQLGEAMMMYLDDNDGRFPSRATQEMLDVFADWKWDWSWKDHTWTWGVVSLNEFKFIQLKKYVKNMDIWICPFPSGPYGQKYAYGYKCSWFFFGGKLVKYVPDYPDTGFTEPDPDTGREIGRILTEVLGEDKAKFGRPGEASKKVFACCYSLGPDILVEMFKGGPVVTPYFPHGEGSIYVYMDGHAKWQETGCGWAPVRYTNHNMDRPHKHGIGL